MDFIGRLCDPVIVMAEGSVLFEGSVEDAKKDERVIEKEKYLQKKRDDNTAGRNTENDTVPNVSETSQEDRPEAGTRDHTHPQTEESEGT